MKVKKTNPKLSWNNNEYIIENKHIIILCNSLEHLLEEGNEGSGIRETSQNKRDFNGALNSWDKREEDFCHEPSYWMAKSSLAPKSNLLWLLQFSLGNNSNI